MIHLLAWWLAVSLVGLIALPLTLFTLRHLPDRGYAASRPLGLLVVSYVAWLAGYKMAWPAAIVTGLVALAALSAFFARGLWGAHVAFLKQRLGYIALVEGLFFVFFIFAMHYKAGTGAILDTEKPADFTMLHALMTTKQMPPHDPWLSGPTISYYYFGYFIVALVAKVTATTPGAAFNMGMALLWALTALMGFGLGYALTGRRRYGLLLAFALSLMGNMDYWFRAVHAYQYGDLHEKYLTWPDNPQKKPGVPGLMEYLFWPPSHNWEYFHASRLIDAKDTRLITEFPAFSFFLGDLHPHAMSLPFFVLTLAISLSLLKAPLPGWGALGSRRDWQIVQFLVLGVTYGSLGFLNSWDLPTVMLMLAFSLALRELWISGRLSVRWFLTFAAVGLPLAGLALVPYLPFYTALQTQLQGIKVVPNRTDLSYWPFLFGGFLVVLVPALVLRARAGKDPLPPAPQTGGPKAAGEPAKGKKERGRSKPARKSDERPAAPPSIAPERPQCVLCGAAPGDGPVCARCGGEIVTPRAVSALPDPLLRSALSWAGARLSGGVSWWGPALLGALLAAGAIDLASNYRGSNIDPAVTLYSLVLGLLALAAIGAREGTREMVFASLMAAFGFAIMAACEWLYFKDLFSMFEHLVRMNTLFKFYIHVWVLLAAAAVPLLDWLLRNAWPRWSPPLRYIWGTLVAMVVIGGVAFPILSYQTRLAHPNPSNVLDGTQHFRRTTPEDAKAVDWLKANAVWNGNRPPVILEMWGNSFKTDSRVATYTGFSTVLGWEGHEEQWRGGQERPILGGIDAEDTVRRRYTEVDRLYETLDPGETRQLLSRYSIRYVYVGALERQKYQAHALAKWATIGKLVYKAQDGSVEIYDVAP